MLCKVVLRSGVFLRRLAKGAEAAGAEDVWVEQDVWVIDANG
ncbi:hypothetical protein TPChic_1002a [Treponema pallidum subsp. pallidum str. Chicago]|nr:hypothetical protein TPChic_1002a [Treponema pallidum subsp. pallidum str. Chicago]